MKVSLDSASCIRRFLRTLLASKDSELAGATTSATQGHKISPTHNKTKGLDNMGEPRVHGGAISFITSFSAEGSRLLKSVLAQHLAETAPKGHSSDVTTDYYGSASEAHAVHTFLLAVYSSNRAQGAPLGRNSNGGGRRSGALCTGAAVLSSLKNSADRSLSHRLLTAPSRLRRSRSSLFCFELEGPGGKQFHQRILVDVKLCERVHDHSLVFHPA